MNKDQIQNMIQMAINANANYNQFAISNIPYHIHNGLDSSPVPAQFLDFTNFAVWGTGTMSGGVLDITNNNISSSSICLTTRANASATADFPQLAAGVLANAPNGPTMRIFEGTFSQTWTVFYLIIF